MLAGLDLNKKQQPLLLVGCAGSGMNVLAQYLCRKGHKVVGMDRSFDRGYSECLRKQLEGMGMTVWEEGASWGEISFQALIISPAVEDSHPAMKEALKRNVAVCRRSDVLVDIFNGQEGLGVAGTSGKSTVTGMLAWILSQTGREPTVFSGAPLLNFRDAQSPGNFLAGDGARVLLELDESEGSLDRFSPTLLGLTNVQEDHMPLGEVCRQFSALIQNSHQVVINKDCEEAHRLMRESEGKQIRSMSCEDSHADFYYQLKDWRPDGLDFLFCGKRGKLNVPGLFNLANAGMALSLAVTEGVPLDDALETLAGFHGIAGRFELFRGEGWHAILDFAHNPEKIRMALRSAQAFGQPVRFIYQPHGYGPFRFSLQALSEVFCAELKEKDELWLLPIFDAGGSADRSIQSEALSALITGATCRVFSKRCHFLDDLPSTPRRGATWILAGARDPGLASCFDALCKGESV